jgi:hypothetical protein
MRARSSPGPVRDMLDEVEQRLTQSKGCQMSDKPAGTDENDAATERKDQTSPDPRQTEHPTGERQAQENAENEPPA